VAVAVFHATSLTGSLMGWRARRTNGFDREGGVGVWDVFSRDSVGCPNISNTLSHDIFVDQRLILFLPRCTHCRVDSSNSSGTLSNKRSLSSKTRLNPSCSRTLGALLQRIGSLSEYLEELSLSSGERFSFHLLLFAWTDVVFPSILSLSCLCPGLS